MTSAILLQNPGSHPSLANTKGQSGRVASATTKVCRSPARTFVSCGAGPGTYMFRETAAEASNPFQKGTTKALSRWKKFQLKTSEQLTQCMRQTNGKRSTADSKVDSMRCPWGACLLPRPLQLRMQLHILLLLLSLPGLSGHAGNNCQAGRTLLSPTTSKVATD